MIILFGRLNLPANFPCGSNIDIFHRLLKMESYDNSISQLDFIFFLRKLPSEHEAIKL